MSMTTQGALRFLRSLADSEHPWGAVSCSNSTIKLTMPQTGGGIKGRHGVITRLAAATAIAFVLNAGREKRGKR